MRSVFKVLATIALLPVSLLSRGQGEFSDAHKCIHNNSHAAYKTTVADVAEDNYDVKYVKLDLNISNASTAISGNVLTRAKVVASSLPAYVFELNSILTIDSVLINGAALSVTSAGAVRTVTLATPLPHDTLFTTKVFYHGSPVSGTAADLVGINTITSPSWGNRATFTLSEPYRAYEWWPCKQSLRDKIDSSDIWLTIPDSLKAGSNGVLNAVTTIDSNHVRYEWKERKPIDYYLISLAVANYVDYSYYMHFSGSSDSMLIQNYIYNNSGTLPRFKSVIDSTGMMIDFFSGLYGRYPFWKEKYGHAMAPLSGGMEHQTMSTVGFFDGGLVAHELGHQWFGDNVTCGTWADIFVNEGFASYSEYMFIDHFRSHTGAINDIKSRQNNVKTLVDGAIFVDDTTNENRIFSSRLSYNKGACVIHMLRFAINNDSTFFNVLKTYQQQMKDSTATIADFKGITTGITGATVNGMNMDTFFHQWIYQEGYPLYTMNWYQSGSDVAIQLNQTTTVSSSVPLFITPVEIKLHSLTGDTTIRVMNTQASQLYHFTWSKSMLYPVFEPNSWLLHSLIGVTNDPSLLIVGNTSNNRFGISPNPTNSNWLLEHLGDHTDLTLTDVTGKIIWTAVNVNGNYTVPAEQLAAGVYIIKITNNLGAFTLKVIKE